MARTRFARLFSDGGMSVASANVDYFEACRELDAGHDDDDVELLEVEVTVVRSHGKPKLKAVGDLTATCPTCGEEFTFPNGR